VFSTSFYIAYLFQYQSDQVYKVLAFFGGKAVEERIPVMDYI
jgi:hypothetical protein